MTKPQMPQMTPDQWESLATAVDALSSALAAVRPLAEWEMDLLSAATPEPDPWPTEPLIVADMGDDRELFSRNFEGAYESRTYYVDSDTDSPLTNVVPVTVVPVAALPVLWSALDRWNYGPGATAGDDLRRLVGAVVGLREQIDALGLDQ